MYFVLMIAGLVSVVIGLIAVALGFPERSFSVGAVLMTCGTMATIGGVLLVGVASILRQLRRMNDVLEARPFSGAAPMDQDAAELREPQLTPVSGSLSAPAALPASSQRSELSLSPLALDARQSRKEPDAPARNVAPEIRSPAIAGGEGATAPDIVVDPSAETAFPPGDTDSASGRHARNPAAEAQPADAKKREPMFRAGARARAELGLPDKPDGMAARSAGAEERPAVLKSGVIEGMAYTLYADGSIDAELAEGTVKFNSIPDLRNYLGHRTG